MIAYVVDPMGASMGYDKIQEVVFKNEKIGLAMKAFRAVKIAPEDAENDPILSGHGKGVPRLLVIDPTKEKVKVLEEDRIKVSTLYKEMKSTSNRFYKEKIDKVVKTHLKLLTERDQLSNEVTVLQGKQERAKNERDAEEIQEELAEVEKQLEELATQEREMWQLTPRNA